MKSEGYNAANFGQAATPSKIILLIEEKIEYEKGV